MGKKIFQLKNFPVLLLIITGLISGLALFRDYGASWDEPDLYTYADQSLKAYSLQDRIEGNFSLNSLLGPDNLRLYGPAYLVTGQILINGIGRVIPGIPVIDLWHLVNYLMFVVGIVFFYLLLKRWFKPMPALVTTLLMACQPVLFGISWIDPKDIPFMVLFILSIYSGLKLIDGVDIALSGNHVEEKKSPLRQISRRWMKFLGITNGILLILAVTGQLFHPILTNALRQTILGINNRPEGDLMYRAFTSLARNTGTIPLEAYAEKATGLFTRILGGISLLAAAVTILTLSFKFFPAWLSGAVREMRSTLAGLFFRSSGYSLNGSLIGLFAVAGILLGVTTSTRVLGPLAGLLIALELFRRIRWKSIPVIVLYALTAILVTICTWPYLWENTAARFSEVFFHMAENPVGVGVLFRGTVYDSKMLPVEYFPWLLGVTLTIPALILIPGGFVVFCLDWFKKRLPAETWVMGAWFLIPFGYVLIKHPPMYDNYRHFLFILPALFFFCTPALNRIMEIRRIWIRVVAGMLIVIPGLLGIIQTHPYEYSYYNELAGGMQGATGKYEVDYWLTCYRELTMEVNSKERDANTIFVAFMPDLVRYYADSRFTVLKANDPSYPPESLIFLPLRREGLILYPEIPEAYTVTHNGVKLCAARKVE